MKHLEVELKTLLKRGIWSSKKQFSHIQPVLQKTTKTDMPDFQLREKKVAMRIRTFSDWAELTLKVPQTVGNMEYNQKLTLPEAESYLEKQKLPQGFVLEKLAKIDRKPWLACSRLPFHSTLWNENQIG